MWKWACLTVIILHYRATSNSKTLHLHVCRPALDTYWLSIWKYHIMLYFRVHSGTLVSSTLREWNNTGIQIDRHSNTLATIWHFLVQWITGGTLHGIEVSWLYGWNMLLAAFSTCCYLLLISFSLYRQSFTSSSSLSCVWGLSAYMHVNTKVLDCL